MAQINTDPKKIDEILTRGVHEVVSKENLRTKLLSGRQLHLKLGIDVTGPMIHLGHAVAQRKIRDFQELGHKVTLIIGDFTTLVGDHSDKVDMREEKTMRDIKKDEETYKQQSFKTIIEELAEVRHNSEWLGALSFSDVLGLAKQFTIAQMLDRETFALRYKEGKPIGLDEFLYPLMQGYDSVTLGCDLELGGTDQTFNLYAGRKLMGANESGKQEPQDILIMKLLTGSDGRPMGKSLKNFIAVDEDHINMYGKVMSIIDELIFEYFELCTRVDMGEVHTMQKAVAEGANPMEFKKRLAFEIVLFYHGVDSAEGAARVFAETVQGRGVSEDVKTYVNAAGEMSILEFLKTCVAVEGEGAGGALGGGVGVSSGEIKQVLKQGGVEVNGERVVDMGRVFDFRNGDLVKFGKRRFFEVRTGFNLAQEE